MKKIILYILFLLPVLAYNQSGGAYHFPKKTTAQRDALTGMIAGEMILNTTTNTIEYYTGSAWAAFGGGAANIDTVAKVSRIANYTGTAKAIVVTDSLEGGLFVLSPKTVSVNNALYYKDGNTRQFARVYDGPLNLWWFGAKPDNTGDLTVAINAAIAASTSTQSSPLGAVDNLYLPSGTYRVASDLILEKAVSLKGVIGENNTNVIVNMNGNKIVIEHNTTSASGTTADATELANIKFVGDGTDTCIIAHANFTYRNIRATNFDVGIATIADLSEGTGNANHWEAHDVQIADCTIGWLVEGDDANHGAAYKLNVIRCDTAIYDRSFLGNSYYTPHTASNGYAFYTTGAQNRSHFHDIYAEGSEGVGKEQWVSINHPSRGNVTTIGNGSQLIGTGYIELGYSQGIGLHYSKNQYYNDVFNLELGGQTGGTRAFEFRGLTDTDPGMTWQYQNGSYVLGHRGFDARRGMAIAGDATTLTNQHGTTRTGGSIVFPWGIWTGGGTLTGNNAARILGNTDTTGIVSPVNGDFMFNSNPTGLGGVPFYYRKNSAWKNPWTLTGTFDDANNEIDFTGESTPAFSVNLQAVMDSINVAPAWAALTGVPAGFADGVDNVDDADASATNELQVLDVSQLTGTNLELSLSNDGQATKVIDLSSLQDGTGTDDQTAAEVSVTPTGNLNSTNVQAALEEHQADIDALASSAGDGVATAGSWDDANNEIDVTVAAPGSSFSINLQGIMDSINVAPAWGELTGVPVGFADGVDNVDDADASPTNELQTISKVGSTVTLSNGGGSFTDAVDDADASPTNELQTISKVGSTVTLSNGGGSFTDAVDDADASPTNELQTLANTSDPTSHTITLSNSDGSVQLIEGSNVTLTTGGTGSAGTVTIAASGLADGDKGDIRVSASGTDWQIDPGAVGSSEIADGTVATGDLANGSVTLAKQANGTANRLLGYGATGTPSEITVSGNATLSAGNLNVTGAAVNPTSTFVPFNSGGTFGDSPISYDGTDINVSNIGINIGGSTGNYRLQIGNNRVGNGVATIDMVGDDSTYPDYGLRIFRAGGGPNSGSYFRHRGTGPLYFETLEAGNIEFRTANVKRVTFNTTGGVITQTGRDITKDTIYAHIQAADITTSVNATGELKGLLSVPPTWSGYSFASATWGAYSAGAGSGSTTVKLLEYTPARGFGGYFADATFSPGTTNVTSTTGNYTPQGGDLLVIDVTAHSMSTALTGLGVTIMLVK